nr:uncharacterized protein LOC109165781 [Ipomoea batatas]
MVVFLCKGGDVVTEDNESKGETGEEGWYSEDSKMGEKREETKEKATETAQEAWLAIEEVAGEMKQRVLVSSCIVDGGAMAEVESWLPEKILGVIFGEVGSLAPPMGYSESHDGTRRMVDYSP